MTIKSVLIGMLLLSSIGICSGCEMHRETRHWRQVVELELDRLLGTQLNLKGPRMSADHPFSVLVRKYNDTDDSKCEEKQAKRNVVMFHVLAHIRKYQESNYDDLYEDVATVETLADFAILGLGGAGALAGKTTSQILSAISAGIVGARSSAQVNILNDMTKFVVIVRMQEIRATQLKNIYKKMKSQNCKDYPLESAAKDLQDLLEDGSIRQAVTNDAKTAVAELSNATDEVKEAKEALDKGFEEKKPSGASNLPDQDKPPAATEDG